MRIHLYFKRSGGPTHDDGDDTVTRGSVHVCPNGLGHSFAKRRSVRLGAPGIPGRLFGHHPDDGRNLRITRNRELEFESGGVHDYTVMRLNKWLARRSSASI